MGHDTPRRPSQLATLTAEGGPERPRATGSALVLAPGAVFAGRYRIVAPLGRGGMGEVYRAEDLKLGHPVALKFLPEALAGDRRRIEHLFGEARVGRQIAHPNVCRLFDCAEADGCHYIVMEYVDGEDLASLLRRIGRLPSEKALEIARGLGAGLAALHERGILHRDLKPANVMIDGRGHARLSDFGLAVAAGEGASAALAGTPAYMAPEQLAGAAATTRSELYAFGLVVYEMLTGRRPSESANVSERRGHVDPASLRAGLPELDPAVERVLLECLERDPARRPSSLAAVLSVLPGGDPLQAALAAGETPSPATVAAAREVGDLAPGVAWALLLVTLVGLWHVASSTQEAGPFRRPGLPHPPEVLVDRARQVLGGIGRDVAFFDTASGFFETRTGPAVFFFFRGSPERLQPSRVDPGGLWTPGLGGGGAVMPDDPVFGEPGEAEVILDPQGRLVTLKVAPALGERSARPDEEAAWRPLFTAAGLDPTTVHAVAAPAGVPMPAETRREWRDDAGRQVAGTMFGGRPVWFAVGEAASAPRRPRTPAEVAADRSHPAVIAWSIGLAVLLGGGFGLARANLRCGRVDQSGAFRISTAVFVLLSAGYLSRLHLHGFVAADYAPVLTALLLGAGWAAVAWVGYVGLEPYVRRLWPRALVSWSRLVSGRLRDPMVGRDVLVGVSFTLASRLLASALGVPFPTGRVEALASFPRALGVALPLACSALALALASLLAAVLLRGLLRGERRALAVLALLATLPAMAAPVSSEGLSAALSRAGVFWLVWGALVAVALVRFGLLTTASLLYAGLLLEELPIALEPWAWYGGPAAFCVTLIAALAVAAFRTSLGERPVFGRTVLPS